MEQIPPQATNISILMSLEINYFHNIAKTVLPITILCAIFVYY